MPRATAPAKVILFGEHAVVYGEPAIAAAGDLRLTVEVETDGDEHTVNGHPISDRYHAYLKDAVDLFWDGPPLSLRTETEIPSAAGLGSSASLAAATVTALAAHADEDVDEETLARRAYAAERRAQDGEGSPTDTATVVHGGALRVDREKDPDRHLWTVDGDDVTWHLHDQPIPDLTFVLGHTGSKGKTSEQVAKVARFVEENGFAEDVIEEIGSITRAAVGALSRGDREAIGDLMVRNQRNLAILGVSTPHLDRLCEATEETAYGAKLTGAGGGGCMLALTDDPEATADAIRRHDAKPIPITLGAEGVRVE